MTTPNDIVKLHLNRISRDIFSLAREEQNVNGQLSDLSIKYHTFQHNAKKLLEVYKSNPEIFDEKETNEILSINDYFRRRKDKLEPIDALLNWSCMGENRSFLLDHVYDLIGKDDARMLRILLRDVITMIDPVKAKEI